MNLPYEKGYKKFRFLYIYKKAGPTSAAVDGFGACGCKDTKGAVEKRIEVYVIRYCMIMRMNNKIIQ